jgi:hypothetical protein
MTRERIALAFAVLCWGTAALVVVSLWAGSVGGAVILGVGFAMSFGGLLGCAR